MNLTQMLAEKMSDDDLKRVSRRIGADEGATTKAASAAVPLLVTALARNAAEPEGAESLYNALERDHDGSIFDDIPGFLDNPQAANGSGILGHVLGDRRDNVENGLAQSAGIDAASAGQLLEILAPVVMGALGQTEREEGMDANGLSQFLGRQQQSAQAEAPDLMSVVGNLLDMDRDGSALDDIADIAGALFRGR